MARTEQANVRLDPDELALITRAATLRGTTVSEYLRLAALEVAGKACPTCHGTGRISPHSAP